MKIEFDPEKNEWNILHRNIDFNQVIDLDWETALILTDDRKDYPEKRYVSAAMLKDRLHILCFTPIPDGIRVISFRKANKREVKAYEEAKND